MRATYRALTFHHMPMGVSYASPEGKAPEHLTLDSPAVQGMTDLRAITALTVERTSTLGAALERMRKLGVRMLLVTSATGAVLGVITATDLASGRSETIASKTGERPEDLQVQDIMTLRGRLEVLRLEEVEKAKVGDILTSLRAVQRRHALVSWANPANRNEEICGIFSLTRLCGFIGLDVHPGDEPEKVEAALASVLGPTVSSAS